MKEWKVVSISPVCRHLLCGNCVGFVIWLAWMKHTDEICND
jgi:hypothetical protein